MEKTKTNERYVRCALSPRERNIFRRVTFRSPGFGMFDDYIPIPVAHIRTDYWELGFISKKDVLGFETRGVFVYSTLSNSLLGPFWCFFQHGRWELYLDNE